MQALPTIITLVIILAILLVLMAFGLRSLWRKVDRKWGMTDEATLRLAEQRGYRYLDDDPIGLEDLPLTFLGGGGSRYYSGFVAGKSATFDWLAFTFRYWVLGPGPDPRFATSFPYEHSSVCVLARVSAGLPDTVVSRETVGHWLVHLVRHELVPIHDGDFLRRFRVTSVDPDAIAPLFDEEMRAWLTQLHAEPDGHDLCFEVSGPWILCFTALKESPGLPALVEALSGFVDRIPSVYTVA